jgi:hypothetical protein
MYGKVLSVETRNLAEPATADAAIAATTLYVSDASTFDETGGFITVGTEVLVYTATDVDANTLTLATGLAVAVADQDPITVYPPTPVKTAFVDIGEEGGDSVPVTVPHSLLDKLPDGTRDETNAETVTIVQRGTYELVVGDIVAEQLTQQSLDYVEGEVGIGLSEAVAQVQDLNAIGQVNAAGITVDSINLAGADLAEQLGATSIGKILSARLPVQGANIAVTTTATKIFELNCGTVQGGRTYRVSAQMLLNGTGTLALTDRIFFYFVYTLDGSTPTAASPLMDTAFNSNSYIATNLGVVKPEAEVDITTTGPLKIGVCADVLAGAGTYSIYALGTDAARPLLSLYDDGPSGVREDSAITLTGGGIKRFVKTFYSTWSFGLDIYGKPLVNTTLALGGADDYCGFVGFDSAAIVAELANVTNPAYCHVRWWARTRQTSAGLDVRLATHNHTSANAASTASSGITDHAHNNAATYGLTLLSATRDNAVPGVAYTDSIGTGVFNQFKAGSRKGVAFLGEPEASETGGQGTVFGYGTKVQLIFTYDGTS